ncbi:hypothetical protein TIFTF001_049109 [Ficus carica]|uniref:Uncharacterized protein n=1 Tax=Ficus carica TaxID=3494 RepID=A0AA88CMW2_FICCA|nr:hypothetical protein TIFTF001_049101 [Ficus carica]GMN23740.1 hypothetical protein TIFTF001_049103 [Ficus carica]GMN23860.1 hypothetical protein TIFTF001_049107 [Ficus carica]GMN23876.1 hypothetical protein TIFTF001_049109 [Ficus carica]
MVADPLYSKPRWVDCSPTFPYASGSSISSPVLRLRRRTTSAGSMGADLEIGDSGEEE